MSRLNVSITIHEAPPIRSLVGGVMRETWLIDGCTIPLVIGEADGITSDGRRCLAITAKREQCPKDSAVALLAGCCQAVHVCGGHFGVHRRGVRSLNVVLP